MGMVYDRIWNDGHQAGLVLGNAQGAAQVERLLAERQRLAKALIDLVRRCDGAEGVRADGSNIQTIEAHATLEALGIEW